MSGFYILCLWFLWGNVSKVGATPLHFAVRWGSESIVKFILRKKVCYDYEDLKSCYSMPRTTSKGTFDMHNNMCNCRAMTWRQCWILVIVWEGLRCTMLQAKKQVPTVSSSVPYQGKIHIGGHVPILNMLHADRSLPRSLLHLEPAEGRGEHRRAGPQWDDTSSPCLQIWKHLLGKNLSPNISRLYQQWL